MKTAILFLKTFAVALIFLTGTIATAKNHIVQVSNYVFTPDSITDVEVGDSIIWVWVEGTHTTTSVSIPDGAATWDRPISQANPGYIYVPTVPGEYNYVCTPHASMGMTGKFTVKAASGIASVEQAPAISIYPNPFREILNYRYESGSARLEKVEIYDLTGRKLSDIEQGLKTGFSSSIDLNDLQPGVYLVKFIDSTGKSWARRVNKQ